MSNIKSIVTNLKQLQTACAPVEKNENITEIVQALKDTLQAKGCWGLSANQIGYNKRISYMKVPVKMNPQTKELEYNEILLINAKIIDKQRPVKIMNESCVSFPGLAVITERHVFITVENYNQKLEVNTMLLQDNEAICAAHEIDHQNGKTIFDRKWRAR
jgi:peptide deformylase